MKEYQQQLQQAIQIQNGLNKRYNTISTVRLFVFLAFLLGTGFFVFDHNIAAGVAAIVFLLAFLVLIHMHETVTQKREYIQCRRAALEKTIARAGEGWRKFEDNGEEFMREDFPQASDLDLLGPSSLYQYLCVAHTPQGRKILAEWLCCPVPVYADSRRRQGCVKELVQRREFRLELQTLSGMLNQKKRDQARDGMQKLLEYGETDEKPFSPGRKWAARALTGCSSVVLLLVVFGVLPLPFLSVSIVVLLSFLAVFWGRSLPILNRLRAFSQGAQAYEQLFKAIEAQEFSDPELLRLQKELSGANQAFHSLNRLGTFVSMRYNAIVCIVLDCLFLWDCHCLEAVHGWKLHHGKKLHGWLDCLGVLEALASLAALYDSHTCTFPELSEQQIPFFDARELYHPLITNAVPNSFSLGAKACIVTGSNMSGKTTFLRSIGINLVLAYAGAPVCASEMKAGCMAVFTSMRVNDDVSRGISTFYAELLRIKSMVQYREKQQPMLCLIDEIFKGTNSADRIVGATETIRRLTSSTSMCIVSTHDFELCELEQDPAIQAENRHFSEHYKKDSIHFDYRIQPGRCRTTNARQLMRMVGILTDEPPAN